MTRNAVILIALISLLGLMLYAAARGDHGIHDPRPSANILEGMTNPRVTQSNIEDTICRIGWEASVQPSPAETWPIKRDLLKDRRSLITNWIIS
jgi:hypothetical protein